MHKRKCLMCIKKHVKVFHYRTDAPTKVVSCPILLLFYFLFFFWFLKSSQYRVWARAYCASLVCTHLSLADSSPGTGKSRGVCILIAKNIPFNLSQSIIDKEGRYIIITGLLYNVKCTLINVYAPNITQATFITSLG